MKRAKIAAVKRGSSLRDLVAEALTAIVGGTIRPQTHKND